MFKPILFAAFLFFASPGKVRAQPFLPPVLEKKMQALSRAQKDTSRVDLLLQLAHHYILTPGENIPDLNKALLYTKEAETLSKSLQYQNGLCSAQYLFALSFRERGNQQLGKHFAEMAVALATRLKQYNTLGKAYMELAEYHSSWEQEGRTQKIKILHRADTALQLAGNKQEQGFNLKNLGDHYQIDNNYPAALFHLKKALNIYNTIGYREKQGVYDLLGYCYTVVGDHASGLKYGLLALENCKAVNDTSLQYCTILYRLAVTHYHLKKFVPASDYFLKAFEIARKYNDESSMLSGTLGFILSKNALKKYRDSQKFLDNLVQKHPSYQEKGSDIYVLYLLTYTAMNQMDMAKKYCDLLLRMIEKQKEAGDGPVWQALFKYYLTNKQFSKAEECLDKDALVIFGPNALAKHKLLRFQLDSTKGNHLAAIQHYQQYKFIQDSLFNESKANLVETISMEYETARKDQDIQIKTQSIDLLTKQSLLREQQLQQSNLIRNGTIVGLAIVGIILLLVYKQYRLKRKTNEQLLAQQREIYLKNQSLQHLVEEKEWLLKEVHHRVKNNLQTVLSLLESQSRHLSNEALFAIQDSQNRVYAMSLIHKKLYQSEEVASVNMKDYLEELIQHLRDSFNTGGNIRFILHIEPVELDVSQAVPVGLVVNEAITNAIKYAFPQPAGSNEIKVLMEQLPGEKISLTVSDNGIGCKENHQAPHKKEGLGMKLMKGLTEDIEGNFSIQYDNGTCIRIVFSANTLLHNAGEAVLSKPFSTTL